MILRRLASIALAGSALMTPALFAQRGGRGGAPGGPVDITTTRSFDKTVVERGKAVFGAKCVSCHGPNVRGGNGLKGADLVRSEIVQMDHNGREFTEFMKFGRPEKGMPKFELADNDAKDLAVYLHYEVAVAADRGAYVRMNVFSGDPKAGEAYFNGQVGKCNTCHSVTGDLKGIGQKNNHDAPTLQGAILAGGRAFGRGGGGRGRGGPGAGAAAEGGGPPAGPGPTVTATVTTKAGETFTGTPGLMNDWVVQIKTANGETKTWLRDGQFPKVVMKNRLQAHVDLMTKYTDDDIHNLAAYLNDK